MTDVAAAAAAEIAGEANVCPHCRAQSRLEPDPAFRWVCGVCGGPRIKIGDPRGRTKKSEELLLRAHAEHKGGVVRRFIAIGLGLTGTLLAALGAALGSASLVVGIVLTLAAVPLLGAAVIQTVAGKRRRDRARTLAFEAWEDVAETLLRAHGGEVTVEEMAALLEVDVAEAERVMTVLAAEDRARVDIGSSAELRYRVPEAAPGAKARVAASAESAASAPGGASTPGEASAAKASGTDDAARAEAEAMADAEADAHDEASSRGGA